MIELFEHNQKAYESAVAMLSETGKAAIVHPTGTGKSFIGFKLCEDNPEKTICWLSPSEYIFKTQLENIKAICGYEPTNIRFYTYAKLMLMSEDEIAEIQPDICIFDEFHRAGAEMWGQGVQNLLNCYPDVSILGLSATAIRYLDNQRDMTDELFDGNIASEMTLGEAIVRGILNPPKYVQAVFSYQKDLERYERRVCHAKNKAIRDAGERYLEALRRAIEMADGLDTVFDKHITDRTGKYIVFCANKEHMDEMMSHVREWFEKIDKKPHVYSVYTEDPTASKSFKAFKEDSDNSHLRLLFAIDALNEGIHVEDVSGVILLRPTVSPIIYKQQIGRALSASKKKEPVIFDIVNNIDNLYSIGAIEDEMRVAVTYYQYLGEGSVIINDRFKVFDEVKSCRELFEKLEDTLTTSWELMFHYAKQYYESNGNLLPVQTYKTPEGYSLGQWLNTQRMARKGIVNRCLTRERIEKLDSIGMVWDRRNDYEWNKRYKALLKYYEEHGNIDVPYTYVDKHGVMLGRWLNRLRQYKNAHIRNNILTPEREEQLNSLGMIWGVLNFYWERNYLSAVEFFLQNGHLRIPHDYKDKNGVGIGCWISNMRHNGEKSLTEEQLHRMNEIGMCWGSVYDEKWEVGFKYAEAYRKEYGNLDVPYSYKADDGFNLGLWISRQRKKLSGNVIDEVKNEHIERLNSIGMLWQTRVNDWKSSIAIVRDYYAEFGNIDINNNVVYHDFWIGAWLIRQRKLYRENALSDEQIAALNEFHMDWNSVAKASWLDTYELLKDEFEKTGRLNPKSKKLQTWVQRQRKNYKNGTLSDDRFSLLEAIGMKWEVDDIWEQAFLAASKYAKQHGNLDLPATYCTSDGINLGRWIMSQRTAYKKGTLSNDRIKLLETIGFEWESPLERQWTRGCTAAKVFFVQYGHLNVPAKYATADGYKLGVWLESQRNNKKYGRLSAERIKVLDEMNINWLGTGNKIGVSLSKYKNSDE